MQQDHACDLAHWRTWVGRSERRGDLDGASAARLWARDHEGLLTMQARARLE